MRFGSLNFKARLNIVFSLILLFVILLGGAALNRVGFIEQTIENNFTDQAALLNLQNNISQVKTVIGLGLGITMLLIILAAGWIILYVRRTLKSTIDFSEEIVRGNFLAKPNYNGNDEFGKMNRSLDELREKLIDVISSVRETVDNVISAGKELSASSQVISSGANNQASTSEEITSAMEQISESVKQNALNALKTGKIADDAFRDITDGVNSLNEAVVKIKDISEKNSMISEISYQTKILSLNASVESARAGDAGKGFSVVADEVKKLAERSQESASEIDEASLEGVEITVKSAEKLNLIVPEMEKTAQLVKDIASISTEQDVGLTQINVSLAELNNVIQQNASASEELAGNSEELLHRAEDLRAIVSAFIIGEEDQNSLIEKEEIAKKVVGDLKEAKETKPQKDLKSELNNIDFKKEFDSTFKIEAKSSNLMEKVDQPENVKEVSFDENRQALKPRPKPLIERKTNIGSSVGIDKRGGTAKEIKDARKATEKIYSVEEIEKELSRKSKEQRLKDTDQKDNRHIEKKEKGGQSSGESVRFKGSGVKINLSDNDEMDSDFERIKE